MKSSFGLPLVFFLATICHAQVATTPVLKSVDLQVDASILRSAYEHLHPGLYRYSSKAEMDENFAALNRQLGHDQSLRDAFLAFSQFAAKVRCRHTQANPFNQSKPLIETLFKSPTRLPFYGRKYTAFGVSIISDHNLQAFRYNVVAFGKTGPLRQAASGGHPYQARHSGPVSA